MTDQPKHRMSCVATYETGAQMYQCPICNHRLIYAPEADFLLVVLTPGDQNAIHVGADADPYPWLGEGA